MGIFNHKDSITALVIFTISDIVLAYISPINTFFIVLVSFRFWDIWLMASIILAFELYPSLENDS